MEKTFILRKLRPFYKNKTKELSRSPLYYFVDLGLRNYAGGTFGALQIPESFSYPFRNLVFNILYQKLKHTGATLHFWRTKDGAEVDFVIRWREEIIPVEVKFKEFKRSDIPRSLFSFMKKYSPKKAFMISLGGFEGVYKVEKTKVAFGNVFDLIMNRYILI